MIIDEVELFKILDSHNTILLLEPNYKSKYPPLGLNKLSTYLKSKGKTVLHSREFKGQWCDLICMTSLFTYDSEKILNVLENINPNFPVIVGGIFASLMSDVIQNRFENVNIFKGCSPILDSCVPDYSLKWSNDEKWNDYSYTFTSRGCANKCKYCAVWRLESTTQTVVPNWRDHIVDEKPYAIISDNNLSSCSMDHIKDVVGCLVEKKKQVIFDNGIDCKHVTPELASLLKDVKFQKQGLRLAFDRIEEDGVFQNAVKTLLDAGIAKYKIMAYVIFNFVDTPQEANYRFEECKKLGIRPYPQQYTPLNKLNRDEVFIGKHWTKNLALTFRNFWLMAGYYTKYKFEDFVKSGINEKYKLTDEDWEAWYKK